MLTMIEKKINSLPIVNQRQKNDSYNEIIFFHKDSKKLDRALAGILGPPVKLRWKKPDNNLKSLTRRYGGIRVGQTLYLKDYDDCRVVAMIWPWKDQKHTTLKLSIM